MLDSIKVRPSDELLTDYVSLEIWAVAIRNAQRSPHNRHRTGATIYNSHTGRIVASGCSHKHDGFLKVNSIHAEQHALRKRPIYGLKCKCLIVTLTKADNFASCSRPCYACAVALQKKMVGVIYAERTNDGGWAIREVPFDLLTEGYLKPTKYA